ncbi:DALR anticodon-binding domain-containing protein [Streptomyces sp. SP18ES09]|uniref:ArgS-related anticodon-binding protein NrtL n=1 Tax=Streptomyces sp. SP18ES09 TaxID=3002532 RepID=UPI002E78B457|nr:DALR anticodon-binding domain-containing protein [Streptomyces sp. SP18ES09]MEE1815205.1 DALR anticodon-binding domain-containing protein [Streptomyces sp. SP18ES09]
MTPTDLSLTVQHAVRRAVDDGALRVDVPPRVKVERARPGGTGEYASSVALTLARPAGRTALDVAEVLKERLQGAPGILAVDITGPGFLNFTLRRDAGGDLVRAVRAAGASYGHGSALAGTVVRFAEVTEPRARVVTEVVVRLLRSQGADAGFGGTERIHVLGGGDPLDALGVDAARWSLLRAAPQDRPLDGPPLLVQHERNSLFRVRYAHARVRRLLVNGAQLGVRPTDETTDETAYETDLHASELLGVLGDHPVALLSAARHRAPDRVARHLEATADALLAFQHGVLPLGDEKPSAAHRSRLALAEAAGTVLAGGLSLLGISAPDQI